MNSNIEVVGRSSCCVLLEIHGGAVPMAWIAQSEKDILPGHREGAGKFRMIEE